METATEKHFSKGGGLLELWTGMLAGPIAWLLQLQTNYILAQLVCSRTSHVMLHVITVVALLLAAGGGLIAWRSWQQAGREWPGESEGVVPRSRFMAVVGLLTSVMFFLVILAQGIPSFILNPCQP